MHQIEKRKNKKADMILTDLNIDCLEAILEFLSIRDLLNSADTCKRLHHATSLVYERVQGQRVVIFDVMNKNHTEGIQTEQGCCQRRMGRIDILESFVITDLKIALKLLRCFGHLISNINFSYYDYELDVNFLPFHNIYVLDYINEFCSETVKELQLGLGELNYNLENSKKPFRAVEKLKSFFESTKYPAPEGNFLLVYFQTYERCCYVSIVLRYPIVVVLLSIFQNWKF